MNLSTSHFRVPRLFFILSVLAVITFASSVFYSISLNPEVVFFKKIAKRKIEWVDFLRGKKEQLFFILGGSSVLFAVDAGSMWFDDNLPVVNMGLGVGMGGRCIFGFTLLEAKAGDRIVVSLEPGLLQDTSQIQALGSQFAIAIHHPEILSWPQKKSSVMVVLQQLPYFRPGAQHLLTFAGKIILQKELYRYRAEDMFLGGLQVTKVRKSLDELAAGVEADPINLSQESINLLRDIQRIALERKLDVAYLLPWKYVPKELERSARIENLEFLLQIADYLPVLIEPQLGIYSHSEAFADSEMHLNEDGARIRSKELVETLKSWKTLDKSDIIKLKGA